MGNIVYVSSNPKSNLQNRLKYGVGYNSGRKHLVLVNGKNNIFYTLWSNMMGRCYSPSTNFKSKSYEGCTVSEEFHDYQDFADWCTKQKYYRKGYCLDKDILVRGNKIYSPETCCFVPTEINNLFVDRRSERGEFPIGVTKHNKTGRFISRLSTNKGRMYLGLYDTPEQAYIVYAKAKEEYVKQIARKWQDQIDENVYNALMDWTV